jgi:hypothetical protein
MFFKPLESSISQCALDLVCLSSNRLVESEGN